MSDDADAADEYVRLLNGLLAKGLQEGVDADLMARVHLNTARELYDHYGAGGDHTNYLEYVVDAQFEQAEIEEYLHALEDRRRDD